MSDLERADDVPLEPSHYITTRYHYDGPPQPGIEAHCRCGRTMLARDESHLVVLLAEHRGW